MAEFRIKVKITNALDEALARRGRLRHDQIRSLDVSALVVATQMRSFMPLSVIERLGIAVRGKRAAYRANGLTELLAITGPVIISIFGRDTVEDALVLGDEVLVGHTVLAKLDLVADASTNCVYPNPAHPEGPVTILKRHQLPS